MSAPHFELQVLADAETVAAAAVDAIFAVLPRHSAAPAASIALAGGRTPLRAYELLAERAALIHWDRVHLFWGDERCVSPGDAASNYGAAVGKLVARVPIPEANVHRIRGELPAEEAAAAYERELAAHFASMRSSRPSFDLVLLGMGADGHTASLFPGGPWLDDRIRWVVASRAPVAPQERVTLTFPALAAARRVVVLVTGEEKRDALRRVLAGDRDLPTARITGNVAFIVDRAARG